MSTVGAIMSREAVTCAEDARLQQVAALMRSKHVGSVVVVSGDGVGHRPIGVVTDRDIVVEVVATGPRKVLTIWMSRLARHTSQPAERVAPIILRVRRCEAMTAMASRTRLTPIAERYWR